MLRMLISLIIVAMVSSSAFADVGVGNASNLTAINLVGRLGPGVVGGGNTFTNLQSQLATDGANMAVGDQADMLVQSGNSVGIGGAGGVLNVADVNKFQGALATCPVKAEGNHTDLSMVNVVGNVGPGATLGGNGYIGGQNTIASGPGGVAGGGQTVGVIQTGSVIGNGLVVNVTDANLNQIGAAL